MPLITVYFPRPTTNLGYAKAIIDEKSKDFFVNMGAHLDVETILKPKPPEPSFKDDEVSRVTDDFDVITNPDRGWGVPGSHEYHIGMIKTAEDPEEIITYTFELTGRKIMNRGTLDDIKRNALRRIKEFMSDDNED